MQEVLVAVLSFLGGGVGMKVLDIWYKSRESNKKEKGEERRDVIDYLSARVTDLETKAIVQEERIERIQIDNIECDRRWRECEAQHLITKKEMDFLRLQINGISKDG